MSCIQTKCDNPYLCDAQGQCDAEVTRKQMDAMQKHAPKTCTGTTSKTCHCGATLEVKPADARLIAAAPDLLAALVSLENFVSSLCKSSEEDQVKWLGREWAEENRLHFARAALAKATGAQP
jgi:hypothetical protein